MRSGRFPIVAPAIRRITKLPPSRTSVDSQWHLRAVPFLVAGTACRFATDLAIQIPEYPLLT